ncbi:hypothetical protein Halru_0585 [Halovivax ruber XH-70]|uniref:Uncharacterized protein n=1 Tax=Halovivax ruber (strain DSM 18193 / JCM 13892 / XH-70) TaxID=797302 RepID=L0I8T4_HALRX|nr:hypothetical protein [Halovivax ruber]AGB15218.1 hypothetical protein Halru_0585 [Halovivax ruber XH-70]
MTAAAPSPARVVAVDAGSCLANGDSSLADTGSSLVGAGLSIVGAGSSPVGAESISVDEAGAVVIVDCLPLSRLVASRAGTPSTCMCPATSGVGCKNLLKEKSLSPRQGEIPHHQR